MHALMRTIAAVLLLSAVSARADTLKDGEQLFSAGDFDGSAKKVNELLLHEGDLKASERAKLYLMKARLESAFGRKHDVRLWLEKAHQTDSSLALDPVLDPPPLQLAWDDIKRASKPAKVPTEPEGPTLANPSAGGAASIGASLLPLGFGHDLSGRYRDGALFLSSELLVLLAANTLPSSDNPSARQTQHPRAREVLGSVAFLGLYGYEVGDLLADVGGIRTMLNFFPLGAAQAKNGDTSKALAIAAAQSMLLTAGALAPQDSQRRMALGLLGVTWIYSIADGFVYDHGGTAESKKGAVVTPFFNGRFTGIELALALKPR